MKTRALVSCLVGGSWVLACGSGPPGEPPEPSAPEDEVTVIATAEAVSAAAATSGAGGAASAAGSASGNTAGSDVTPATASASGAQSASGGPAADGGATGASTATDAGATSTTGSAGASGGAGAPTGGSGGDSPSAGGETETDASSSSATSGGAESGTGGQSATGESSTSGEVPPPPIPVGALLITEYVESGDNKAVEISNLGPDTLSLAECRLETYFNGNVESTSGVELAVELAPGQSWVLCNSPEHAALLAICDQPSSVNFNGNDALVLRCNTAVHDSFGQVGGPGEAWQSSEAADGDSYSSEDHVLRRRCGALPRTDPLPMFEVALTEDWVSIWEIQGAPTGPEFDGLGKSTCADRPVPGEGGASSDGSGSE